MMSGAADPGLKDVSVIIPVLNSAGLLGVTLERLGPFGQVIVCDGGSSDDSLRVAGEFGADIVQSARGRGLQLAAGGCAGARPWLLFLHADTHLDDGSRQAVADYVSSPGASAKAGVFALSFDDAAWQARVLERLVALRVRLFGLAYGDQGLLIHRDLYNAIGGFKPLPLMEDVDLVRRLGRGRIARLPATVVTSADRWRRRGWVRQSARNLMCLSLYFAGVPATRIAKIYGR